MIYVCDYRDDDGVEHGEDVTAAVERAKSQQGPRPAHLDSAAKRTIVVHCSKGHLLAFEVDK